MPIYLFNLASPAALITSHSTSKRTDMRGPQRIVHGRHHATIVGYVSVCDVRVEVARLGSILLKLRQLARVFKLFLLLLLWLIYFFGWPPQAGGGGGGIGGAQEQQDQRHKRDQTGQAKGSRGGHGGSEGGSKEGSSSSGWARGAFVVAGASVRIHGWEVN